MNIDIINKCLDDEKYFNKFLGFNSMNETLEISLVVGKYHLWYLKNIEFVNVSKANIQNYFEKNLDKNHNKERFIQINYCLGEIYLKKDTNKSYTYFSTANNELQKILKLEYLNIMSEVHIGNLTNSISQVLIDRLDFLGYESNYIKFKIGASFEKDYAKNFALWLYSNCINYKDVKSAVEKFFSKNNLYQELINHSIKSFLEKKDLSYINNILDNIEKLDDIDKDLLEELIKLLYLINNHENISLWAKLTNKILYKINSINLEMLFSHIDNTLKNTSMYTYEFEKESDLVNLLKNTYEKIYRYKGQYDFLYSYEENITNYLLYASFQNSNVELLYEAYDNLNAINKVYNASNRTKSVLITIGKININNKLKYHDNKIYPFESLFENLKYIIDDSTIFSEIFSYYQSQKLTETKIMLYGMFSAGKSSFINSFLDENLVEVGDLPTTSTFTLIGYSDDKNLEEKIKYKIPTKKVITDKKYLKDNNLIFVDTPGFEDLNNTQGELSTQNAYLFNKFIVLLDAARPLNRSEYNKIKGLYENIKDVEILFILNKIDGINEDEEDLDDVVEQTRNKLKNLTDKEINISLYSSEYVNEGDVELRDELALEIDKLILSDKANIRLKIIEDCINMAKNKVSDKLDHKINNLDNEINFVDSKIKELLKIKSSLEDKVNDYTKYIENFFETFKLQLLKNLDDNIFKIFDEVKDYIDDFDDIELIYYQVKKTIRININTWSKFHQETFIKEGLELLLSDVEKYIHTQNKSIENLMNNSEQIYNLILNTNFSIEKKYLENFGYIKYNFNSIFERVKEELEIDLNKNLYETDSYVFDLGIKEPKLQVLSKGISKIFNNEQKTLDKHKNLILEQLQESYELTYNHIVENYIDIDDILTPFKNVLLQEVPEDSEIFKNSNLSLIKYNIKNNLDVIEKVKMKIVQLEDEKLKIINYKNDVSKKIENLNVEIYKYRSQIENNVIYDNNKLYRLR